MHNALDDAQRLQAVSDTGLDAGAAEPALSTLTELVTRVIDVPVSMITLSETEREIIAASTGLSEPWASQRQIPHSYAWSQLVVSSDEPLLVDDTAHHPLVGDSPAVAELNAAAYAGVPLHSGDGHVLGALCAIDSAPRRWLDDDLKMLARFATLAEQSIDSRLRLREEQRRRRVPTGTEGDPLGGALHFRDLVETSLAGIYVLQDDRLVYANPRMREIFGFGPDDPLATRSIFDFVAPQDRERVAAKIRARTEGRAHSARYTFRALRADGTEIDVEVFGTRVNLNRGPAILGTLLDVTDRRRAEAALRESATRLRLIERATEDVIWDWDAETGEVRWSDLGRRLLRYGPAEVGRSLAWHQERIHPDEQESVIRNFELALSGVRDVWSAEYRIRRGDGEYVTVLDRACIVRDERGSPVRMIGSMMDVTERRREEDAQRLLSQASALLDQSIDPETMLANLARLCVPGMSDYCQIDLLEDGSALRRVATSHVDPTCERTLTRTRLSVPEGGLLAQLLSRGVPLLLTGCGPADLEALGYTEEERSKLCGREQCTMILVPLRTTERVLGLLTLANIDSGRRHSRVDRLVAEDLARRISFALDHARLFREATEAVRARDEVLAVVSHDLRNPLNVIMMASSMLQDLMQDRRADNQRWLELITRNAGWMIDLIADLLDASRLERSSLRIRPERRAAHTLLADGVELLRPLAAQAEIRLETRIADDLPEVYVDPSHILRVIGNLVDNAIKFTPPDGRILVEARRRGSDVLVAVSDTGPGLPQDQIDHVFDRYWQARQDDRRGTGLGLSIVRGIVEAHGGRIWAENARPHGATFSFTLPAARSQPAGRQDGAGADDATAAPPR
jgi:PAS domain S-box-containing protein